MSDVYPIIAKDDIRAGDNIRVESVDEQGLPEAREYWAEVDGQHPPGLRYATYRLMHRPTPPLPTVPGTIGWATIKGVRTRVMLISTRWVTPKTITGRDLWRDPDLSDFREGPVDEGREEQIEKIAEQLHNEDHNGRTLPGCINNNAYRNQAARMYDQGTRVLPTGEEA